MAMHLVGTLCLTQSDPCKPMLEALYSIKRGSCRAALAQIQAIGECFSAVDFPAKLCQDRVQFIGRHILSSLEETRGRDEATRLQGIILEMTNLKNAMQMEAIIYGGLSPAINFYCRVAHWPQCKELWETLPLIFSKIHVDESNFGVYQIDISCLKDFFDTIDIPSLPESFDKMMLQIVSSFPIIENRMFIPTGKLPPREHLETFILSADPHSKLLAQLLYVCKMEEFLSLEASLPRVVCDSMIKIIETNDLKNYLEKRALVPYLSTIIDKVESLKALGRPSNEAMNDLDFLRRLSHPMDDLWVHESAEAYELIRKIDLGCRKIFTPHELSGIRHVIEKEGCDERARVWGDMLNALPTTKSSALKYPLSSATPFCNSIEDFALLPQDRFFKTVISLAIAEKAREDEREAKALSKLEALSKKAHAKKAPVAKAIGGASGGSKERALEIAHEELEPHVMAAGGGGAAAAREIAAHAPRLAFDPSLLESALNDAQDFLVSIKLDQRVRAWQISDEAGLAHYNFDDAAAGHVLTREEMILRHSFPPEIFLLAFAEPYASKKLIEKKSRLYQRFQSCLVIDDQKFILEATINSANHLYHFYAKPLKKWADYFSLGITTEDEFPKLAHAAEEFSALDRVDIKGITFDAKGNATVNHKGRVYKMLMANTI